MAVLAGVSKATVSRALADNDLIALKTRRRIQDLAKEVGFTVNPAARMLRTRQSHTIALVLPLGHEERTSKRPVFHGYIGLPCRCRVHARV
ncbi:LacI family DNA-binding transcriptional regulator [Sphingomonas aerolata]|uniref:LacI family DNA-binding transcriptional regulator n=1 Tax=Sphingomonas aerolata TaxID=185951 RepID=UPI002FDF8F7B